MNYRKNLLLLYDRPREPIFMGKGKSAFDMPDNYLTDRYRPIGVEIQNRFGEYAEERIPVRGIALPDLRIPMSLGRQEQFFGVHSEAPEDCGQADRHLHG